MENLGQDETGISVAGSDLSELSHLTHTAKGERRLREQMEREGKNFQVKNDFCEAGDVVTNNMSGVQEEEDLTPAEKRAAEAEKRAAWRKARLRSLENDAIQAQMVIAKMSELVTIDGTDSTPLTSIQELQGQDLGGLSLLSVSM